MQDSRMLKSMDQMIHINHSVLNNYFQKAGNYRIQYVTVAIGDFQEVERQLGTGGQFYTLLITQKIEEDDLGAFSELREKHSKLTICAAEIDLSLEKESIYNALIGKIITLPIISSWEQYINKLIKALPILLQNETLQIGTLITMLEGHSLIIDSSKEDQLTVNVMRYLKYIQHFKRIDLYLYSLKELDVDGLCEIEDILVEYTLYNSKISFKWHERVKLDTEAYFMIKAF